jgi:hypothetical protein
MSARLQELRSKREALLIRSAQQRGQLSDEVHELETQLQGIDRGLAMARRIVKHPMMLAGGIALVALIGPRKILRIASRGAAVYSTGRRVLGLIRK